MNERGRLSAERALLIYVQYVRKCWKSTEACPSLAVDRASRVGNVKRKIGSQTVILGFVHHINHKVAATMATNQTVPWPGTDQPSAGVVSSQRRAFGDARARLENAAKQNANTKPGASDGAQKENMSTTKKSASEPLSSRRSNAGSSGGESIVAKFGAMYGGTTVTTPSGKSANEKENVAMSSNQEDTTKKSSTKNTNNGSSTSSVASSSNPVASPKFQSLRDAFQKRSDSSAAGGVGASAVVPSLSDGFANNKSNGARSKSTGRPAAAAAASSSNASRRASREQRSKSAIRPSRGSIEVYDENIQDENHNHKQANDAAKEDAATGTAGFASPQVLVSKSKIQKMKQSNVRLKSEAWEKGVRLQQTQSALYDLKRENEELRSNTSDSTKPSTVARQSSASSVASNATNASANSEVESVRLRLQNKELKSEVASLRATASAESSSSEVQRLRADLKAARAELNTVKGAAGTGEMYNKLRRNLEGQADKLQAQLDAEMKKSRSLERQIDEMRAPPSSNDNTESTAANKMPSSNNKKERELQKDLSTAMFDLAAKDKEISKLQTDLKKATNVVQYDNANDMFANDPVRRRDAEIRSLRQSLNDFKALHSDCDVKTELLSEKEAKLQESHARAEELERSLEEARNSLVMLQNESARQLEKTLKAKEQNTMQQWSAYKKQEAMLREEIASRDEELDETRADIRLLESKLEEAEHLVAATVERVDGLKAELSRKDAVAEKANEAMEMLQTKLSIAEINSAAAEKTISDMENQLSILAGQKQEILDGLEKSAEQIDQLNKTIQDREIELAAAKDEVLKEIAEGKFQNKVLYDSLQQSSERVTELQKTLKDKDEEIATLQKHLSESDENYKSLQKFMERGTEQIEVLEAELEKKEGIERKYKSLHVKYEDVVVTLERSSKESLENSTRMGELLESKEKELTEMREELDVAKAQAEEAHEYQATIEELEDKLSLSEKMVAERENRIDTLEETVEEQEQQMQEHCERITASAREMQTVLEDASVRQSTLEKALTELDADLQESNKLNEEHEATIKKMEDLFVEYEEKLTAANDAVETQKKDYEEQIELLRKVIADMESIHQSLRGELAEREGELHASTHKVDELEKAVADLNASLAEKQDELERMKDLAKELAACQADLEAAKERSQKDEETVKDLNDKLEIAARKLASDSEDTKALKDQISEKEDAFQKLEVERDALLKDVARIAEEKATTETDYKCLESTVDMYKMTIESQRTVSQEKIQSLKDQLLDAERTHADAEADLNQALEEKNAMKAEMGEMKKTMENEINQLKAEIADKDREISETKNFAVAMKPVPPSPSVDTTNIDCSIDEDLAVKNADMARKLEQKDEELENMRVCLDYLKERVTKANTKNDTLQKEVRQMLQRNIVLENELRARDEEPAALTVAPVVSTLMSPDCVVDQNDRQQIEQDALMKYVARRQEQQKGSPERFPLEEDADPRC